MATETMRYAVVCKSTKYGPSTEYRVVGVYDSRAEAEVARMDADQCDRHAVTGLREMGHNEASRDYVLAEVVAETGGSIDWDHVEGYCCGEMAEVLRGAGWTEEQIEQGTDDDMEALERGIDAILASAGLIGACDGGERGAPNCYILRIVD